MADLQASGLLSPSRASLVDSNDSGGGRGHGHGQEEDHEHMDLAGKSNFNAIVIVIALSLHGIFEGLALGTQLTTRLFGMVEIAVAAHLPLGAFALGVGLVKASLAKKWKIILLSAFSCMCPIGIAAGMILTHLTDLNLGVLNGVCSSIAAGTFIFIGVVEILPKEMSHGSPDKQGKILCLLFGFTFMAAIKALPGG